MCRRHIPNMLSADEIWCQFYSEPEAGSDLAGIRTGAVRDGEQWIINGSKIWTTGRITRTTAMCLARTNWDVPKHRGLTWFAIPTSAKGVTIRQSADQRQRRVLPGVPRRRGRSGRARIRGGQ